MAAAAAIPVVAEPLEEPAEEATTTVESLPVASAITPMDGEVTAMVVAEEVPAAPEGEAPAAASTKGSRASRQGKHVPRWTTEEEELLKTLVAELGERKWSELARRMNYGRSAASVEQHWCVLPLSTAGSMRAAPCLPPPSRAPVPHVLPSCPHSPPTSGR